jgi:uncharacterized protein YbjT (DUF2867 family)
MRWRCALLLLAALAAVSHAAGESQGGKLVYAGASGSVGRLALPLLREQGYAIRAISRNPARAAKEHGTQYQWVYGDVRDPDQVQQLLAGAEFVVCSIGYTEFEGPNGPQFVDYMGVRNLVDAAKANGVKHFVLVSAGNIGPYRDHTQNPRFGYVAYWKDKSERYLKKSGLPFTIVGPTGFTDGAGGVTGILLTDRSKFDLATITRADVAAVTVASVNNPDAIGRSFYIKNDPSVKPGAWRNLLRSVAPEPMPD